MRIHKGISTRPLLILVHGLGMTENSWVNPYHERTGMGRLPYDYILVDLGHAPTFRWNKSPEGFTSSTPWRYLPHRPPSFWDTLARRGYNLLTWSQREQYGPVSSGVEQLQQVWEEGRKMFGNKRVMLIGHSQGGLIIRECLRRDERIRRAVHGAIFLATPHHGSRLADVAEALGKLFISLEKFLPAGALDGPRRSYSQWTTSLRTRAVEDLKPQSSLVRTLQHWEDHERKSGIRYVNLLGVSTCFNKIYRIVKTDPFEAREIFSLLDSLPSLILSHVLPDEWINGRGDGLVAEDRGRLAWIPPHDQRAFPVNHASLLIDRRVRAMVLQRLEELSA